MDACGMMFCRAFAVFLLFSAAAVSAEKYETANFVVTAASAETGLSQSSGRALAGSADAQMESTVSSFR